MKRLVIGDLHGNGLFKDIYEYELYPTRKSIAILDREYLKKRLTH